MEPTYEYVRGQGWIIRPVEFLDTTWEIYHSGRYMRRNVRLFNRPAMIGEYSRSKPRGIGYDINGTPILHEWIGLDDNTQWILIEREYDLFIDDNRIYCAMVYLD